jgi:hypothetical protein
MVYHQFESRRGNGATQKLSWAQLFINYVHMVGITKKSCYGTFHVKVDVDMHYAIIFATINAILLIVI